MKRLIYVLLFITLFFQGCSFNQSSIKSVAQTNSASEISSYKNQILDSLVKYKNKLDIRNPQSYNKSIKYEIINQIKSNKNYIHLKYEGKKLHSYNSYFHYAFLKDEVLDRNDFLILGLYKLIYNAYSLDETHQFTAMQYNKQKITKLYEYLQVLRWKIRTSKDKNNNYLFKTWQNNWQLELLNKKDIDINTINELKYIKSKKESLFSNSNFSFEVLLSKMINNVEYTMHKINIEPYEMSFSAIRSFVFIL